MNRIKICVVFLVVGSIYGLPLEGTRTNLESLIQQYYGPPPEPHISSVTENANIPQKDIDNIFGKPSVKTKYDVWLVTNDDKPKGETNNTEVNKEIDENALKSLWPDALLPQPENVESRDKSTVKPHEENPPLIENTSPRTEQKSDPNASSANTLFIGLVLINSYVCICNVS